MKLIHRLRIEAKQDLRGGSSMPIDAKKIITTIGGFIGLVLISAELVFSRSTSFSPESKQVSIAITNPEAIITTVGEGDDFATVVIGNPWDMNERRDVVMK
ncbi:MAG: hypothetical protein RMK30_10425 [Anaerolineae bacterium]|nr:hypothetical protein [Anaerolineae bacterium]